MPKTKKVEEPIDRPSKAQQKAELEEASDSDDNISVSSDEKVEDKTPRKKLDFDSVYQEYQNIEAKLDDVNTEIATKTKEKKTLEGQRDKILCKLNRFFEKGVHKKKRKPGGCVTKEETLPDNLCKYLSVDIGTKMTRPDLTKAMYAEFERRKLVKGRNTTLDKETAKLFGMKKDEVILFQQMPTKLKGFYTKATDASA